MMQTYNLFAELFSQTYFTTDLFQTEINWIHLLQQNVLETFLWRSNNIYSIILEKWNKKKLPH